MTPTAMKVIETYLPLVQVPNLLVHHDQDLLEGIHGCIKGSRFGDHIGLRGWLRRGRNIIIIMVMIIVVIGRRSLPFR